MTGHAAARHIAGHYYLEARIFTDPHIFQEELDKLFGHAWVFLGHECEAQAPDSYFCFEIGGTPVVICRNAAGRLHGFIDACRECGGTVVAGRWGKVPSCVALRGMPLMISMDKRWKETARKGWSRSKSRRSSDWSMEP